jgi:rubrerythrin
MEFKRLFLEEITIDARLQMRVEMDPDKIDEYAEVVESLPNVEIISDGETNWLTDGFHTYFAHKKAKKPDIACNATNGTFDDAVQCAAGSNFDHGLPRTTDDKRKAVAAILSYERWQEASDRAVAEICHVSPFLVATVRATKSETTEQKPSTARASSSKKSKRKPSTARASSRPDSEGQQRTGRDGKRRASTGKKSDTFVMCARCSIHGTPCCPKCRQQALDGKKPVAAEAEKKSEQNADPKGGFYNRPKPDEACPLCGRHDDSTYMAECEQKIADLTAEIALLKKPKPPAKFEPPTIDEVTAYCQERGGKVDAQKWYDHYTSNGWKVGRNPMKDWRAAVRTWEKSPFSQNGKGKADQHGGSKTRDQSRFEYDPDIAPPG